MRYTITSTTNEYGTISPLGTLYYIPTDEQTFTMSALPGAEMLNVSVDDIDVGYPDTYMFSDIRADHTIDAYYTPVLAPTPSPVYLANCMAISGKNGYIYVFGGGYVTPTSNAYKWNRGSVWTQLADMPRARCSFWSTKPVKLMFNETETKIFIIGCESGSAAASCIDIYDIATDTWDTWSSTGTALYLYGDAWIVGHGSNRYGSWPGTSNNLWSIYTQPPHIYNMPDGGFFAAVADNSAIGVYYTGDIDGEPAAIGSPCYMFIRVNPDGAYKYVPGIYAGDGAGFIYGLLPQMTIVTQHTCIDYTTTENWKMRGKDIQLPSGKILIFVDNDHSGGSNTKCLLYNPDTNTFKVLNLSPEIPTLSINWSGSQVVARDGWLYITYYMADNSASFMRVYIDDVDTNTEGWYGTTFFGSAGTIDQPGICQHQPFISEHLPTEVLEDLPYGATGGPGKMVLLGSGKLMAMLTDGCHVYDPTTDTWGAAITPSYAGGADYAQNAGTGCEVVGSRWYFLGSVSPSEAPYSTPTLFRGPK
jgi:hypothetical protein